jgi:hypothetical protein
MNDELEKMWMETVVVYFKELSQNLPGWTEESHKNTSVRIARIRVEM